MALDYFCGAAAGAELVGNNQLANGLGSAAAYIISVRGYVGVKELAGKAPKPPEGLHMSEAYRRKYAQFDSSNGDDIAAALKVAITSLGPPLSVDLDALYRIAADNGLDPSKLREQHEGLNPGMTRMNVGTMLRATARRGEPVTIGIAAEFPNIAPAR